MRENNYEISKFICHECGGEFPLPRQKAKRRNKGHVKDLWCPYCQKTVKTTELRPRDVFRTMDGRVVY